MYKIETGWKVAKKYPHHLLYPLVTLNNGPPVLKRTLNINPNLDQAEIEQTINSLPQVVKETSSSNHSKICIV